jgi:hypothetical protein
MVLSVHLDALSITKLAIVGIRSKTITHRVIVEALGVLGCDGIKLFCYRIIVRKSEYRVLSGKTQAAENNLRSIFELLPTVLWFTVRRLPPSASGCSQRCRPEAHPFHQPHLQRILAPAFTVPFRKGSDFSHCISMAPKRMLRPRLCIRFAFS